VPSRDIDAIAEREKSRKLSSSMIGCTRNRFSFLRGGIPAHRVVALVLAVLLLSFEVEPFEDEYEDNNPLPTGGASTIAKPASTWETCDKNQASKAFVFTAVVRLEFLVPFPPLEQASSFAQIVPQRPRDKSPPNNSPAV
jgi:hypothetical protein